MPGHYGPITTLRSPLLEAMRDYGTNTLKVAPTPRLDQLGVVPNRG
jgi:hypothetical protein